MIQTTTLTDHVERYVATKRHLGYKYRSCSRVLSGFARFAEARNEGFIRTETVLAWILESGGISQVVRIDKLRIVHAFARWMHAEDVRHEVPPRDALGRLSSRRRPPCLVSVNDIRRLLSAALEMGPAGTIAGLTWHYLFGLIAVTGLRNSEVCGLTLDDITEDGLVIREAKFGKSRLVVLHPTTREALNRYLAVRLKEKTPDNHLFVIATGRCPCAGHVTYVFRKLAYQVGIRKPGMPGPTPHSLRHSFVVRSLENLDPGADPSRHMLALATYVGHAEVSATYWYLESTPILLRGIAKAAEQVHAFRRGGSHD